MWLQIFWIIYSVLFGLGITCTFYKAGKGDHRVTERRKANIAAGIVNIIFFLLMMLALFAMGVF